MRVLIYEDMLAKSVEILGCIEQNEYENCKKVLTEQCGTLGKQNDKWTFPWYEFRIEDVRFVKPKDVSDEIKRLVGK